jgi:cadmium resistance protein CadD (predicted permease)
MLSQEYVGAIALLVISLLQTFGIVVEKDAIAGIIAGLISIWIAYRRYQKGDITVVGLRK